MGVLEDQNKKNVCLPRFHCEWVWCVVVSAFWQRVVCVIECGVCHCVGAKWLSWVVRVCRLGVEVCGW